jgi:hypothetical protein
MMFILHITKIKFSYHYISTQYYIFEIKIIHTTSKRLFSAYIVYLMTHIDHETNKIMIFLHALYGMTECMASELRLA